MPEAHPEGDRPGAATRPLTAAPSTRARRAGGATRLVVLAGGAEHFSPRAALERAVGRPPARAPLRLVHGAPPPTPAAPPARLRLGRGAPPPAPAAPPARLRLGRGAPPPA